MAEQTMIQVVASLSPRKDVCSTLVAPSEDMREVMQATR